MVTPAAKREAVGHLRCAFEVSEALQREGLHEPTLTQVLTHLDAPDLGVGKGAGQRDDERAPTGAEVVDHRAVGQAGP